MLRCCWPATSPNISLRNSVWGFQSFPTWSYLSLEMKYATQADKLDSPSTYILALHQPRQVISWKRGVRSSMKDSGTLASLFSFLSSQLEVEGLSIRGSCELSEACRDERVTFGPSALGDGPSFWDLWSRKGRLSKQLAQFACSLWRYQSFEQSLTFTANPQMMDQEAIAIILAV